MNTLEGIRFALTALLLTAGLAGFACAVFGTYRFRYVLDRIHSAGIGDTFSLFCTLLALILSSSSLFEAGKLLLVIFFMWFTSPVSTHFLGQAEYYTNPELSDHVRPAETGTEKNENR